MKIKITLIVIGLGILIATLIFNDNASNNLKEAQNQYNALEEMNQELAIQESKKTVTVDQTGAPNTLVQKDNEIIQETFKKATTFTDGKSYTANRKVLEEIVKDKKFFESYMPEDVDTTGNSYVDGLGSKSEFVGAKVYQLETKHQYLVVVESIPYTKEDTLDIDDKDLLNKKTGGFIVTLSSNGQTIEEFKQIKGFNNK